MKYCSKCKENKRLGEFNFKNKEKGNRQAFCRSCQKIVHSNYYKNNSEYFLNKNRLRKKLLSEFVNNIKNNPCMDCGIKYPPVAMDFDHRENKLYNISEMVMYKGSSKKNILKEIKKCDLVCANCHRIRTHERNLEIYPSSSAD